MFCGIQVAELVIQESQKFDLSLIMHLVTLLSSGSSSKSTGFMCIVRKMSYLLFFHFSSGGIYFWGSLLVWRLNLLLSCSSVIGIQITCWCYWIVFEVDMCSSNKCEIFAVSFLSYWNCSIVDVEHYAKMSPSIFQLQCIWIGILLCWNEDQRTFLLFAC